LIFTKEVTACDDAFMNSRQIFVSGLLSCIVALSYTSCGSSTLPSSKVDSAFAEVQTVLEVNCVHCHGDNRLSTMPPIQNSDALSKLVGKGGWIVPGKPEQSRFFQVVTFPDTVPGAMPPTGHAIRQAHMQVLREWITNGAKVPSERTIKFTPRGALPRSV
jgi:mono/diheme cytochrome c family protein